MAFVSWAPLFITKDLEPVKPQLFKNRCSLCLEIVEKPAASTQTICCRCFDKLSSMNCKKSTAIINPSLMPPGKEWIAKDAKVEKLGLITGEKQVRQRKNLKPGFGQRVTGGERDKSCVRYSLLG